MTESGLENIGQEESMLTKMHDQGFEEKLSPSSRALLRFIKIYEQGGQVDVFQEDHDIQELKQRLNSHRGSLYSTLVKRLDEVVRIGGVSIISQRDVMSVIRSIWEHNISNLSRTELPFLRAALRTPSGTLAEIAKAAALSYPQARRAQKRLFDSGVLKICGMLNLDALGLERVLVLMESPSLALTGPYIGHTLMIDGHSNIVISVATIPVRKRKEFLDTVRSTRNTTANTTLWGFSPGTPHFSGLYFTVRHGWVIDLLHFRLMLRRGGEAVTLGEVPAPSRTEPSNMRESDLRIIDSLVESYDGTASTIMERADVSTSTAFRRRAEILRKELVLPRARVNIPVLSDRVCCLVSHECIGSIVQAWNCLPLTYQSPLYSFEESGPSSKKVLLVSALPAGSGRDVIRILEEEVSRVHDFHAFTVSAAVTSEFKVASLYDSMKGSWKWGIDYFDARGYSTLRREATSSDIPVDLA